MSRQSKMRAVVWTAYGPPGTLELREVPRPVIGERDVLIEVHAATVSAGDTEVRQLRLPGPIAVAFRLYAGIRRPRRITVLGQEVSGVIAAVGSRVRRWRVGDEVVAATGISMGGHAQYVRLRETGTMASKPKSASHEAAATLAVGGVEAVQFMRQAYLEHGRSVLINGAGGSIGTVAVQIAKLAGAYVTAVDMPAKHELLRSLGADDVVDHGGRSMECQGGFDVIFDVVGAMPMARSLQALKAGGRLLVAFPRTQHGNRGRHLARGAGISLVTRPVGDAAADLAWLCELVAEGAVAPVVDRTFPLCRAVDAHRYVETGEKRGTVVLTIGARTALGESAAVDEPLRNALWLR